MKTVLRYFIYFVVICFIIVVHTLYFVHHPPEVQLAFLTPGVTLVGYSIIRDDFYVKPTRMMVKRNAA
jgi:hypothetical protein